jgi:integrase
MLKILGVHFHKSLKPTGDATLLTESKIRNLKPEAKTKRYFDGHGLYLKVRKNGSKYWRWKYRFGGKEKLLAFGVYPTVTLKAARFKRDDARRTLLSGADSAIVKNQQTTAPTFQAIAEQWLARQTHWAANHRRTVVLRLHKAIYNTIGSVPITELQPIDFLTALRRIESRGSHVTAHKVKGVCSQICRFAVAACIIPSDPTRDLKGALTTPTHGKFSAFTTPQQAGEVMRALRSYNGYVVSKFALLLTAYTFPRQKELRHAEWTEIDLQRALWIAPAEKMKMKREHVVPLSTQSLDLIRTLQTVTGGGKYLFPSVRTASRPMSEATCLAALRRMRFTKEEITAHGFRAMASSILNEAGYNPDVIEMQLAHAPANKIRAAYNRAQYLPERCKLMQDWADMLDAFESQES